MFGKKRMKVLSISQLAMAAIFLTIGMADRYKVGYKTSLTYMPCWISSLVRKLIPFEIKIWEICSLFKGGIGLLLLCITPWSKESQPGLQIDYVIDYRISPVELMIITILFSSWSCKAKLVCSFGPHFSSSYKNFRTIYWFLTAKMHIEYWNA